MKKIVLATVALGVFSFGYLEVANALFLSDGTDVGDPDTYLTYTTNISYSHFEPISDGATIRTGYIRLKIMTELSKQA
jgi:hypothetical protein